MTRITNGIDIKHLKNRINNLNKISNITIDNIASKINIVSKDNENQIKSHRRVEVEIQQP